MHPPNWNLIHGPCSFDNLYLQFSLTFNSHLTNITFQILLITRHHHFHLYMVRNSFYSLITQKLFFYNTQYQSDATTQQ